ncbi:MAG: hypothetical protein EB027_06085 [Actinobacteria bacterium]|jgi:hypothetical protein|nr:hypothetical protein [Actinomycetota bacterium]
MADRQHTATADTEERHKLALAIVEPDARFGTEWTVWVDYAGTADPASSDSSFMVGYGAAREVA